MNTMRNWAALMGVALLAACGASTTDTDTTGGGGGGGSTSCTDASASDTVILPLQTKLLSDGTSETLTVVGAAGNYRLVIDQPSGGHGLQVTWPDAPKCPSYSEASYFNNTCALPAGGRVIVTNPNTEGSYGDEHYTVKLVKTANACQPTGTVVAQESDQTILDGYQRTYQLGAGTYRVSTSPFGGGHGLQLQWTTSSGATCPQLGELTSHDAICTLADGDRLTLVNPADHTWGPEHVNLTITAVASTTSNTTLIASQSKLLQENETFLPISGLAAGNYRLDVSGAGHGVMVEWVGASNCPRYSEAVDYHAICNVPAGGSVRITNPSTDGGYGPETVTLQLAQASSSALPAGTVVLNDANQVITDGYTRSYRFGPGTYLLELSAPGHGVSVAWTGGSGCTDYGETTSVSTSCTLTSGGTLTLGNPASSAYGPEHPVIKVTKTN